MKKLTTRKMVKVALYGAITIVLGLTQLGFIPIGPLYATTMHIPVIIASILEGPIVGGLVGMIFGFSSLWNAITRPTAISPIFYNPLISIVPRIIIGIVPHYLYHFFKKYEGKRLKIFGIIIWTVIIIYLGYGLINVIMEGTYDFSFFVNLLFLIIAISLLYAVIKMESGNEGVIISSFVTTLLHSLMVMGGIYLLYAEKYVEAMEVPLETARSAIFGVILTSGVPEGILAVIVSSAVVKAVLKSKN